MPDKDSPLKIAMDHLEELDPNYYRKLRMYEKAFKEVSIEKAMDYQNKISSGFYTELPDITKYSFDDFVKEFPKEIWVGGRPWEDVADEIDKIQVATEE